MADVVQLRSATARAARAEQNFLACSCNDESSGFAPVMIHDAAGAFICALVCVACGNEVPINNGRVVE
jgi:hypothetical protein